MEFTNNFKCLIRQYTGEQKSLRLSITQEQLDTSMPLVGQDIRENVRDPNQLATVYRKPLGLTPLAASN